MRHRAARIWLGSSPLPFGMHGVTLAGQDRLNLIRHYGTNWDPNGNQTIPLQQAPPHQLPSTAAKNNPPALITTAATAGAKVRPRPGALSAA